MAVRLEHRSVEDWVLNLAQLRPPTKKLSDHPAVNGTLQRIAEIICYGHILCGPVIRKDPTDVIQTVRSGYCSNDVSKINIPVFEKRHKIR